MAKKVRNSNFEMLRILSMFAIIFGHLFMFTNWKMPMSFSSETLANFGWVGAKWGVNIFVLISAFFLSTSNKIHWKSLGKLWGSTYFYYWVCMLLLPLISIAITPEMILTGVFPILRGAYWFVTGYVVTVLLSPFLNIILQKCSKKQLIYLLLILFVFISVGPTFLGTNTFEMTNGTGAAWIIFVYLCGGVIRRFADSFNKIPYWQLILFTAINIAIIFLWIVVSEKVSVSPEGPFANLFATFSNKAIMGGVNPFSDGTSPFELLASISTFIIAMKLPATHSKLVNRVAGSTFAVYLVGTSTFGINLTCNVFGKLQNYQGRSILLLLRALEIAVVFFIIYILIDQALKLLVYILEKVFTKAKKLV